LNRNSAVNSEAENKIILLAKSLHDFEKENSVVIQLCIIDSLILDLEEGP
jgi:hypothetical protein